LKVETDRRGPGLGRAKRSLPDTEVLIEVALKAVYQRDLKSIIRFLGWVDRRKLNRAVKLVRKGKKHPLLESYIERVLLNSVRIKWSANGSKNIWMMRSRYVQSLVLRYYFRGRGGAGVEPMILGMVKRIRHNVHVRLRRMDNGELRQKFASLK
jgi:hypothetical protein